jgi:hypothetical protein
MKKYIDAEKLIELVKEWRSKQMGFAWDAVNGVLEIITSLRQERPEVDLAEESYMRGFAQGAKEERESLSPTMLTYAADVFGGKMLPEDISYSYRQELADYFRDLAKTAIATNAGKEESNE